MTHLDVFLPGPRTFNSLKNRKKKFKKKNKKYVFFKKDFFFLFIYFWNQIFVQGHYLMKIDNPYFAGKMFENISPLLSGQETHMQSPVEPYGRSFYSLPKFSNWHS